jgi:NAD+ kinase
MKIGIYGQFYHKNSETHIQAILNALQRKGVEIVVEKNFLALMRENQSFHTDLSSLASFTKLDTSYDLFFSIGGDGTILKSITFVRDLDIPIVGVNTGRLGFLATIQKQDITSSITEILEGNYYISERSLLSIETSPSNKEITPLNFALNEVAVNRKNTTSMIKVETTINSEYLTSYWSDGLIVSTPTGSTGYSLSCGGPVIEPSNESIILTPIAPHNLNVRPLVVPDNSVVTLKVSGREDTHLVSLDSRSVTLEHATLLTIKKAACTIKFVHPIEESFIKTLRKKLLWGEDKRN